MDAIFQFKDQTIKHGESTILCGIVNVTPDSFSDGGKWFGVDQAVERAKQLLADGCTMIDVGGESTRPGSHYVQIQEEIDRVVPVIERLKAETDAIVSVDTWKADVAQAAIEAGVDIINDITGLLGDPKMADVVAKSNVGVIVMLNPVIARPNHPSAKIFPNFGAGDVFTSEELKAFDKMNERELMMTYFDKSLAVAKEAGISKERIMLDPGIGFGLTKKENYSLIQKVNRIHERGFTCFLGVSRKRFIQNTLKELGYETDVETDEGFKRRDQASAILTALATYMGVEVVRIHEAKDHLLAAGIAYAVREADHLEDIHFSAYQ